MALLVLVKLEIWANRNDRSRIVHFSPWFGALCLGLDLTRAGGSRFFCRIR